MAYDEKTRLEVASEVVDGGATVAEASRSHGISYQTVYNWVRRLAARREAERRVAEAEEREAERRRGAALSALLGGPNDVVLLEVETPGGPALVMVDRGRGGSPTGTVRSIAGASLGTGPRALGRVRRRWVCDARALAGAIAAAIANDPSAMTDQRSVLRDMGAGE